MYKRFRGKRPGYIIFYIPMLYVLKFRCSICSMSFTMFTSFLWLKGYLKTVYMFYHVIFYLVYILQSMQVLTTCSSRSWWHFSDVIFIDRNSVRYTNLKINFSNTFIVEFHLHIVINLNNNIYYIVERMQISPFFLSAVIIVAESETYVLLCWRRCCGLVNHCSVVCLSK